MQSPASLNNHLIKGRLVNNNERVLSVPLWKLRKGKWLSLEQQGQEGVEVQNLI